MIKFIVITKIFVVFIFFSHTANSLTSSSYLIANAAIIYNDYETAVKYFSYDQSFDSNLIKNKKKLVSFVNTNKLEQATVIATQIINSGVNDEDAWIVYLIDAKLNNNLEVFNKFESLGKKINIKNEFEIIDYIFYNNNLLYKNNNNIAEKLLNIVQELIQLNIDQQFNIEYFIFYLSLVLNLSPNFNEAIFLQAQFFQHVKNYDKAEKVYNSIEFNHALYLEGQKNIALNKNNIDKFDEAEELLINLINTNSDDDSLVFLLADLYRNNKIYDKAIEYYTKLLKVNNIDNEQLWKIFYMRGICYERLNKWDEAEYDFLKSLEYNSEQHQVLNYLAYGWIERNVMIDKSLEMLELAVKKNPKSFYILDSLAWAYFKKNKLQRAVEIMEEVIQLAPAEAISLDHLGDIYFELGRKREAYFMWTQAKDLAEPEDEIIDSVQLKLNRFNEK